MDNLNTTQLNKDKTKNLVISVVAILLIAGGIYYSKMSQKDTDEVLKEGEEVVIPAENEEVVGEEQVSAETPSPVTTKPEVVAVDKTKFNSLLQEGAKAFMDKNYSLAIKKYNEALALDASSVVYIRLYSVYNAQGDTKKAEEVLNKAIAKDPTYTDYWTTKLTFLDEKTNTSFAQLKAIYEDGLKKAESQTKVNLATNFAGIAENNKQYGEAISAWQKAIELYPTSKAIYQAEIDRINSLK